MSHPFELNVCLVSGRVSNSLHTTVTPALNYCTHLCCQSDYSTIDPPHQFAPDIQMKIQKKSRNPEIQMKLGVRPLGRAVGEARTRDTTVTVMPQCFVPWEIPHSRLCSKVILVNLPPTCRHYRRLHGMLQLCFISMPQLSRSLVPMCSALQVTRSSESDALLLLSSPDHWFHLVVFVCGAAS